MCAGKTRSVALEYLILFLSLNSELMNLKHPIALHIPISPKPRGILKYMYINACISIPEGSQDL